jgi:lipopolysaccharide transport system ATP-binding protein
LYLASSAEKVGEKTWDTGTANADVDEFRLYAFRIKNCAGEVSRTLDVRESFLVEIEYEITTPLPYCRVGILVTTAQGVIVFEAYDADYKEYSGARNPGRFVSKCVIPGNLLSPGSYLISINAGIRRLKNFIRMDNVLMISVEDLGAVGSHMGDRRSGLIRPDLIWEREAR